MRTLPRPAVTAHTSSVDLKGVTRLFGAAPAVVRVSLTIEPGEAVVLRGDNGAGKSTLLRIVATSLSPTYGTGTVLGFDLLEGREEIRRRCDLLSHRTRLYEDLTARENLRLFVDLLGLEPGRVDRSLERVALVDVADERIRGFSQGMRQRVAVARTLIREPELLLLDEPTTGLDATARAMVDAMVLDVSRSGRTVVIATHHDVPAGLDARVVWMRDGQIAGAP